MNLRLIWLMLLAGCTGVTVENDVLVGGNLKSSVPVQVQYFLHNYPDEGISVLHEPTTDSLFLRYPTNQPVQVFLSIGAAQFPLYLQPGDSLYWTADVRSLEESLHFSGRGASINNYLAKKFRLVNAIEKDQQATIPASRFFEQEAQLLKDQQRLLEALVDPDNPFYAIEEAALLAEWANSRYYYLITSQETGSDQSYWDKVPKDNGRFLVSQSYRKALVNWQNQRVMQQISDPQDYQTGYHAVFEETLAMGNLEIADFLLATNLHSRIDYFGIDGLGEDFNRYQERFSSSPYLAALSGKIDARLRLKPGNPAPDVAFLDPSGGTVRLSDFKGQPVYIDLWASWCKPCLEEIPFRAPLASMVGDDAVLLNISVDNHEAAWLAALEKYPEFDGQHVLAPGGWQSDLMLEYLVQEIPKYMIIDKNGMIVTLQGPPPSEPDKVLVALGLSPM